MNRELELGTNRTWLQLYVLSPLIIMLSLFQGDRIMEYGVIPRVNPELMKEGKTRGLQREE